MLFRSQSAEYKYGNTTISKIRAYCRTWEKRCYENGIPDSVPKKLMDSGRVPSYRHIAILLLKNDLLLRGLGFSGVETDRANQICRAAKAGEKKQLTLNLGWNDGSCVQKM